MATPPFTYESATEAVYNAGVVRVPHMGDQTGVQSYREEPTIYGDVLGDKDVVGGQVALGFKARMGTPLTMTTLGVYIKATDFTKVDGFLLLSVDAYDGPRQIDVIKGGTIRTDIGGMKEDAISEANLAVIATAMNGRYDAAFKTIKI